MARPWSGLVLDMGRKLRLGIGWAVYLMHCHHSVRILSHPSYVPTLILSRLGHYEMSATGSQCISTGGVVLRFLFCY